ncbi:helix-turn-helix domain-containing protein [Caldibacillus lycopersici]|uniref:Helix-turn-helix domain-containing protein n=1 Tax=Perspicuibacillus lycopersici TaxID=1325689 RepID=A0AAE3IVN5_9BACI|nr:helix-turn-helix domain-containing protein [Perspicuibacillus lycopersici]MCU9613739.1 helix-turn-helix domain-containing protein [Perspicuibacillus lycopersici]
MNYTIALSLLCIERFNGERSTNAVYYLLTGKKSSQTIQDAGWYQLRQYYHAIPQLSKQAFDNMIKFLLEENYICNQDDTNNITDKGKEKLGFLISKSPFPKYFNGWKYQQLDEIFWKRLSLLIQTISYWNRNNASFYPVQRSYETQSWVKNWLYVMKNKYDKQALTKKLYGELQSILSELDKTSQTISPTLLIYRLSSYQKTGMTSGQLANTLNMDEEYYAICFRSILHYLINTISHNRERYSLLWKLLEDLKQRVVLTQSTQATYQLLQQGKSLKEIAHIRRLKKNTIEDHLIEIALIDPDFSIEGYVPPKLQEKIIVAAQSQSTRKLRTIKEHVQEADYFMIRLVLSKWSESNKQT